MNIVSFSYKEIEILIKDELGFDNVIDFGPTGRKITINWSTGPVEQDERAEIDLWDVINVIPDMSDEDFKAAAEDGIRLWLRQDKATLKPRIQREAERMKEQMLAEPQQ